MTVNLHCEPVAVGQELLITVQLKVEITDPEALDNHALVADLYAALEPARRVVERIGMAKDSSLSFQGIEEMRPVQRADRSGRIVGYQSGGIVRSGREEEANGSN